MKNRCTITMVILLGVLFSACHKSDIEYENNFQRSYKAWIDFKEDNQDSYRYVVPGSTWSGAAWETTITVKNGTIVNRDFHYLNFLGIRKPIEGWNDEKIQEILDLMKVSQGDYLKKEGVALADVLEWSEQEDELGLKTSKSSASSLLTLDEIYELARKEFLKKRPDAKVFFETANNGLISTCGYVNKGCQDDCFNGFSISSILPLAKQDSR